MIKPALPASNSLLRALISGDLGALGEGLEKILQPGEEEVVPDTGDEGIGEEDVEETPSLALLPPSL